MVTPGALKSSPTTAGSLVAARLKNVSGGRDAEGTLVADFLFGLEPVLNVATTKVHTIGAQGFAGDERDRLRLDLADVSSGRFAIHKLFRCGRD